MLIVPHGDNEGVAEDEFYKDNMSDDGDDSYSISEMEVVSPVTHAKASCLRNTPTVINVADADLKEHSDDEWYPPTPPLYDVTDKLREINTRDDGDGVSTDHVQSAIRWKKDIVQVKFIENVTNDKTILPRNTDDTVNGLRFSVSNNSNIFIKQRSEQDPGPIGSLNFIEKICAIDDLCLNDSSLHETKISFESHEPVNSTVSDKVSNSASVQQPSGIVVQSELLPPPKPRKSELTIISPVIEEISKNTSNEDNDTASEISEIPTDDEKDKEDPGVENLEERGSSCDKEPNLVPSPSENDAEESLKEEQYSSFDEESPSQCSLSSTSSSTSSYSSKAYNSSMSNSDQNTSPSIENLVNSVDRFKKQKSPDNSLRLESRTNQETKTSCESHKEVKPADRDIREEIKVEFERQHKYIRSRDFIKKSPEDSGFESFQQSSVEQNSNQDSDEDDVIATFSTVMEVENEVSTTHDDLGRKSNNVDNSYTTQTLFQEAEEARSRSRRLREKSLEQLKLPVSNLSSMVLKPKQSCDKSVVNSGDKVDRELLQEKAVLCQKSKFRSSFRNLQVNKRGRSADKKTEGSNTNGFQSRSLSSQPLNVRELAKELRMKDITSLNVDDQDGDSEDEKKPHVVKAVNVWRARKKEEAKLKRRYQVLCNKYQMQQKQASSNPAKH